MSFHVRPDTLGGVEVGGVGGGSRTSVSQSGWAWTKACMAALMRPGRTCARPKRRTWARRGPTPPWSRCPARARGGSRWPGWCACGQAAEVTCSTGSASTAGARASAARCPKPTTPAIAAAHNQLHAPVILIWDNLNTGLIPCSNICVACSRSFSRRARPSADRPPPDARNTPPDGQPGSILAGTGSGLGLASLRQRVELVHGTLRAGRSPDGGFSVQATLPASVPTAEPAA